MIAYIRSSLFERDVRAQKYVHFLGQDNMLFIQWDREGVFKGNDPKYINFKLKAGYGKRMKSFFKFLQWNLFLLYNLFKYRKKIEVIQICDLDSFYAAIWFRLLGKKVIFDVYDFFTDSKLSRNGSWFYNLLYHLEMFSLRFPNLLILPLEHRKRHINFSPKNIFICENVPLIDSGQEVEFDFDPSVINVVYAGTLEREQRGLEWIPSMASSLEGKVHFYVAGNGTLRSYFEEAAKKHSNITYLGILNHSEALSLQKKADLIYGIYQTKLLNNVMAAPNKFYESTCLGTPLLTNEGLYISEMISENKIGFVLKENKESVLQFLENIRKEEIRTVAATASLFWQNHYQDYLQKKYKNEYQFHLASLTSR